MGRIFACASRVALAVAVMLFLGAGIAAADDEHGDHAEDARPGNRIAAAMKYLWHLAVSAAGLKNTLCLDKSLPCCAFSGVRAKDLK